MTLTPFLLVALAQPAPPSGPLDAWSARLAAVGDTVALVPHFGRWLAGVARLAGAVGTDAAGRAVVEAARAAARGPLAFDPFDGRAWADRGARLDGPALFAQRGGRVVATVVPAAPGAAARLAAGGAKPPRRLRIAGAEVLELPGLLLAEVPGAVVGAVDARTLAALLASRPPDKAPPRHDCPPGADDAHLLLLGAHRGRRVADGVAACTAVRLDAGRATVEVRLTGPAGRIAGAFLARGEGETDEPAAHPADAAARARLRFAPSARGLIKLRLVRWGLHRHPFVRALVDQSTGDVALAVDPTAATLTLAAAVRDPEAVRAAAGGAPVVLAAADWPASVPRRWRRDLRLSLRGSTAVLSTAGEPAPGPTTRAAAVLAPDAALAVALRPALVPVEALREVLAALTPDAARWAPLIRRLDRATLTVHADDGLWARLVLEAGP